MDRRAFLALGTVGLAMVALVVVTYPFFVTLTPSVRALNDSLVVVTMPSLETGVVHSVDVEGKTLFILRPSAEQVAAVKTLDGYVTDVSNNSYREDIGAYVYWAYSSRWGCPLEHKPPQDSTLRESDPNARWLGGYWDWRCEVSYDYAGRAISAYQYTFNGFTWAPKGLETPKIFVKSGDKYVVSKFQR